MYTWKDKDDTVICVSGDSHWLLDKKHFTKEYHFGKGEE
jgi:hypothetical protein